METAIADAAGPGTILPGPLGHEDGLFFDQHMVI